MLPQQGAIYLKNNCKKCIDQLTHSMENKDCKKKFFEVYVINDQIHGLEKFFRSIIAYCLSEKLPPKAR